jgi:hypothetical protein
MPVESFETEAASDDHPEALDLTCACGHRALLPLIPGDAGSWRMPIALPVCEACGALEWTPTVFVDADARSRRSRNTFHQVLAVGAALLFGLIVTTGMTDALQQVVTR